MARPSQRSAPFKPQVQYPAAMTGRPAPRTLGVRLVRGGVLGAFGAFMYYTTRVVPQAPGGLWVIAAIGLLLLAGTITSELLEFVGLPHITGYLLAGVIAGPHVLDIVDEKTVETLSPVNTLALSLIALAGGAELDLQEVRKAIGSLGWAMLAQFTFNLIGAAGTFLAMRRFIPFVQGMPVGPLFGVAILWAVLATPRSPSATLGPGRRTRESPTATTQPALTARTWRQAETPAPIREPAAGSVDASRSASGSSSMTRARSSFSHGPPSPRTLAARLRSRSSPM